MQKIERRSFLVAAAGAAGVVTGLLRKARAADNVAPPPEAELGKTGVKLSRVGQGTGMHGGGRQSDHTRMGYEKLVSLFHHDYDRGIRFYDLADMYGSHVYFREALRKIPRDKIAILTKLWWRFDGEPGTAPVEYQKKSAKTALERFRHELTTDYIDIVLLHCLTSPKWTEEMGAYMDVLSEAKSKKQVRAVGVSCHDFGALKAATTCPWVDVILARINPAGASMDAKTEDVVPVLRAAKENGKAIIGMKIYGEGKLADRKEECIRFAQGLGFLDTMTVGAMSPDEMDETLSLIAKYPASKTL